MELMSNPTCVIVYRHPARVALRLGHHWYKGAFAKMSAGAAWVAARVCMDTAHFNTHTHTLHFALCRSYLSV